LKFGLDPQLDLFPKGILLEVGEASDQVVFDWGLFEVVYQHWYEQVKQDELSKNQECKKVNWGGEWSIGRSIVINIQAEPAIVSQDYENWDKSIKEGVKVGLMIVIKKSFIICGRKLEGIEFHTNKLETVKEQ
jgi:hypothetical protein